MRLAALLAVLALNVLPCGEACAQAYPAKPVRMVVPYPPGGAVDFVGRVVSQRLSETLKQPFVVDNRSGARGTVGADAVAKSAPDGHTLLVASLAEAVFGSIVDHKLPYDAERDLSPVSLLGESPLVIAAHPSVAAASLQELIALAKRQPNRLSYGTPGNGTPMHFAAEAFVVGAGISMLHVPYRGGAAAVSDLLGGQIPLAVIGIPPVVPYAKSGRLRALAVTGSKRSVALPEVPAVAELPGFAGYRFTNWMGLYAPAHTPQPVIERLAASVAAILREPQTREKLLAQGIDPVGNSSKEFAAFIRAERERYSRIAKEKNIRGDV